MRRRKLLSPIVLFTLLTGTAPALFAQTVDLGSRGPRFLWAPADGRAAADASNAELLHRRVSITVLSGTLDETLKEIARQARLELIYSEALVRAERRVTLQAQDITVAAALTEVLLERGVDVVLLPTGQVGLVPKERTPKPTLPGTIVGTVMEAETGSPVVNAQIAIDGRGRALTDDDGRYRIGSVEPGRRAVSVTSIGYARASRDVEVDDDATVVVDFTLEVSASRLDQIVVTVTGEQRVRELGHVVARIDADSLVREAPVSTISQLLTGRVPGLQVFQSSGIVGGDVQLQVRTPNSLLLGTQPIVYVDGVRYTSTAAFDPARTGNSGPSGSGASIYGPGVHSGAQVTAAGAEVTSPLNDLNPNDIESIEVVKGSAAATLYGTDAANGVVLITTKRGAAGPPTWNAYMAGGFAEIPNHRLPTHYWAWGTRPDGSPFGSTVLVGDKLVYVPENCTLANVAAGACAQDSVTVVPNPLDDPELSMFTSAPQWMTGVSVSGGGQDLRYHVSGSFQHETGAIAMPRAFADSIAEARGSGLPAEQSRPNALRNVNLRSNLTASLGDRLELQGSVGYVRRTNRTINSAPYSSIAVNASPTNPWGMRSPSSPDQAFARMTDDRVDRFIVGWRAEWWPASWLRAYAGGGLDLSDQRKHALTRRGETRDFFGDPEAGEVQEDAIQQRATTADLGLAAHHDFGRLSSRTTLGAQYVRTSSDVQQAWGRGLIPGGESVPQADERSTDRLFTETVTLGSYIEQTLGLNDRLFLTGALRLDGASNFGQAYEAAVYPKVSASWLVSEEPFLPRIPGVDELRLRYAFGVSGQQAYSWMQMPAFTTPLGVVDGNQAAVVKVSAFGNERLRPERATEHEFGFDVAALSHRLQAGLAWYHRRVADQILSQTLPPGLGSMYTNLGVTTARGFEASISASLLRTRLLSWDVTALHSSTRTRLVDLGDAAAFSSYLGGYREGYPLGARFQPEYLGFEDLNADGIIVPSELLWSDTAIYVGETVPPRMQTLTTTFGILDRRVRVSATFNRSTGHIRAAAGGPCHRFRCPALLDPSTPVEEQARALSGMHSTFPGPITPTPQVVRADETRFAELSVAVDLPSGLLDRLRLRSGALSMTARNLALWTRYPLGDPGSVAAVGISNAQEAGIPQSRTWTFRLDVGF